MYEMSLQERFCPNLGWLAKVGTAHRQFSRILFFLEETKTRQMKEVFPIFLKTKLGSSTVE